MEVEEEINDSKEDNFDEEVLNDVEMIQTDSPFDEVVYIVVIVCEKLIEIY
jgi:hypothetical protein